VVHVPRLLAQQPDKVEEIFGPPVKVAIDAKGKYTRAAESFAQKNAVRLDDLARTSTPKGEYLSLRKTTQGLPAQDVLSKILPAVILGVSFPKSMYWTEKSGPRFIRPIRWVLALLGEGSSATTVEFEIVGVKSGNFTFGHRAKTARPLTVTGFRNYTNRLSQAYVEIDKSRRRHRTATESQALLEKMSLTSVRDEWLTDWIVDSTEWPRPVLGTFDERFLHLPREILTTVMRDHQRYFAVEDRHGNLMPHFVAVLNMDSDPEGVIRKGHQRVVTARFRDAEFFWTADQRTPLRDRLPLLDKITHQAKLGSYGDKVRRMLALGGYLADALQLTPEQRAHALRAVELAKCDLTTQMVQEFTELQGIVGGLYAKAQAEYEEVATAIYDHYLPVGAEGKSPRTPIGALVSLADKMDSVVGGFLAGLEPTGSRDPFALRRAGNGIIKVMVEFVPHSTLANLVIASLRTHGRDWHKDGGLEPIVSFLEERVKFYLEAVGHCRQDTVRAVMAVGSGYPAEELKRALALERIRDTDDYVALAAAAKRTRNLLRKSASGEEYSTGTLDPGLFQEEAEVELHQAYASIFATANAAGTMDQDYETTLTLTARLRPAIDKFFDKVLVMHQDPAVRKNRLLLLELLDKRVFSGVADLSEIGGE